MAENKKLSAIVQLINDDMNQMMEDDGYVGDISLTYLTEKQAEIAIYLGAPIGVKDLYCNYHGSRKGEYGYNTVHSMKRFDYYLKKNYIENRASIYPYVPDPKRMRGYIEQVEEMDLPAHEIKAAGGYGLKQLRQLASTIEYRTGGKLQVTDSSLGGVYIRQDDNVNIGLHIRKNHDFDNNLCRLEFQGYIRRMGVYMSVDGVKEIAGEAEQLVKLLSELEKEPIIVSEEEMAQWAKEIASTRLEQEIADASEQDQKLDPTMGMM